MPISNYNYCNDKLKALIDEFDEDAVKSAVNRTGIMEVDANVNKGLICHTGIGLREHKHTLHAAVGFAGYHASFRMVRDMGFWRR